MSKVPKQARRWAFTWHNYTDGIIAYLSSMISQEKATYIIFGEELGDSGNTPHLQGYVEFKTPLAMSTVKSRLDPVMKHKSEVHVKIAIAGEASNTKYCSKDGKTYVFGKAKQTGLVKHDNVYASMLEFIEDNPDMSLVLKQFPEPAIKGFANVEKAVNLCKQRQQQENLSSYMKSRPLRRWQERLVQELAGQPDDRKVIWYHDPIGNTGKSWLCKYLLSLSSCAYFNNAKSTDIAHAYKGERIALFDFSRDNEERLNYQAIETTKNGIMFSGKYDSCTKVFSSPWVVCMANFPPQKHKLSLDRWDIRTIKVEDLTIDPDGLTPTLANLNDVVIANGDTTQTSDSTTEVNATDNIDGFIELDDRI